MVQLSINQINQGENMKDIKSLLVGFLSCMCMFLFMGQTDADGFEMQVSNGNIHISDEYGQFHQVL